MFLLRIPSQYCVCARANAEHHNATLNSCILKLMGKTHSWINFIHINKGNIADLQNDNFLLAQPAVRLKRNSEFSRKVSAPKATKWIFGTACRNTGQRDPLTSRAEESSDGKWCPIISFKGLKWFSLFLY